MSTVYLEHRDAHHVAGARTEAEIAKSLHQAAEAILACDALLFTAGAGMGVDSGLPDFRGTTGLWKDKTIAMSYEEMSDDKWFLEDPAFAWGINYTQLSMYRNATPHAGYSTLLKWANTLDKPYFVWTSNIDGMFEKVGFPSERVSICHGDLHHLQCIKDFRTCKSLVTDRSDLVWSASIIPDGLEDEIDSSTMRFKDLASLQRECFQCPRCGSLARPNVWFCHDRNYNARADSVKYRDDYNKWLGDLQERKARLVVIECGAGMAIPSVRVEGEDAVESCGDGSLLVRFNPKDCKIPATRAVGIPLGSMDGLQRLDRALAELKRSEGAGPALDAAKPRSGRVGVAPRATAKSRASPSPKPHRRVT